MKNGAVLAALLAFPLLASAEATRSFAQWRDRAQPVESLAQFLTSFIGDCDSSPFTGKECQQKVDAFRKQALNNPFYAILDDSAQKLVQPHGFDPRTHEFEFLLTPYFEGGGYALTHGQPTHQDAQGHPVLPLIRMTSKLADNIMPMDVDRLFRTGAVRMQIIYRPLGLWRMPRKDKKGAFIEGVKAQLLAVRLTEERTGAEVVSMVTANK